MHRCFATAIEPLVDALTPRTVVEVGAGHGRLTSRVLRASTRADLTIHAIDPRPAAGLLALADGDARVHVHAARGIDALGGIAAADLVLLDGDPNWATVRAELDLVVAAARAAGQPSPVICVHNVHWPFGRRDGYDDPAEPAPELRQPSCAGGLRPGASRPDAGGLRVAALVAVAEGGPGNGVLTAVDDFVTGDPASWQLVEVPGFGGTAVLADSARVALDAGLARALAALRSPELLLRAARRAEAGRIEAEVRAAAARAAVDERSDTRAGEAATALAAARSESEAELAALRAQRDRLAAEAHDLRRYQPLAEAAQRRVERLEAELAERERSAGEAAGQRDEQARLALEARVRLEYATSELADRTQALERATAELASSRRAGDERQRRLDELAEAERMLSGRVLHLEDSLGAARAELDDARATASEHLQRLDHARSREREAAEHVRAARSIRRARFAAAALRALGRGERGAARQLDLALDLLERDSAARSAAPSPARVDGPGHPTPR